MKCHSRILSIAVSTSIFAASIFTPAFAGGADLNNDGKLDDKEIGALLDGISDAEEYLLDSFLSDSFDESAKDYIKKHFGLQDVKLLDSQARKIYDYIKYNYTDTGSAEKEETDSENTDLPEDLPVYSDAFSSEEGIGFPLFECVQKVCHSQDFSAQILNPEYSLDVDLQKLDYVRVYLSCYADATKEELQSIIENNTDQILSALQYSFPNILFDVVSINWKIPVIDEDSLYSASYWCEFNDGSVERGDGIGELYQ